MAEHSGFFNAIESEGSYDRVYDASDFASIISMLVTDGVFIDPANQLKVTAKSGLILNIKAGRAFIDGYWYVLDEDMQITLSPNSTAYARKDVICCTLNKTQRKISCIKREGVSSTLPINDGSTHDLVLAEIAVGVGVATITDANITDRRPYDNYCGFVKGAVETIDTSDLFTQFESEFNNWFNSIKGTLDDDAATSLAKQIQNINSTIDQMPTIRSGTEDPVDSVGKDGDVYIKITE